MVWTNPYQELQRSLREALHEALRRTNGCVTRDEFLTCTDPDRADKAEKMLLRLCRVHDDGTLEWKPEIVSEESLVRKLSGSPAVREGDVRRLWSRSYELHRRTAYPYLAPSGHKSQLVRPTSWGRAPVFGLDVLVRPPVEPTEGGPSATLKNDLVLGEECIALVIHGTFEGPQLVIDGRYEPRLVVGDDLAIPKIVSRLPAVADRCASAMFAPLRAGDARGTVSAALPHLDAFAREAALAFVN